MQDIKDRTPNANLIRLLEKILKDAKSGEVRTCIILTGWADDSVSHSWSLDTRNSRRKILAEMVMMLHNSVNSIEFLEKDSVLYQAFDID